MCSGVEYDYAIGVLLLFNKIQNALKSDGSDSHRSFDINVLFDLFPMPCVSYEPSAIRMYMPGII